MILTKDKYFEKLTLVSGPKMRSTGAEYFDSWIETPSIKSRFFFSFFKQASLYNMEVS